MAATAPELETGRSLLDELLAEQRQLPAVSHFSQWHDHHSAAAAARSYRGLIPLDPPKPGEQYAFEVDLDRCSGCKACVSACHSLNGLDEDELWRATGLLIGGTATQPYQQTVTTACHHCVDPGCLNGCPVLAYEKDPLTGIVRHLDDQCIGCQYCVMKCPYDVPKYSAKRGIVRKCDMCYGRLTSGEAPACAQACPGEAIRITNVETRRLQVRYRESANGNEFLPDSPEPRVTLPATHYRSAKPFPKDVLAADHARNAPSDSHLPLVFMLVLTQLAVGTSCAAVFLEPASWLSVTAAATGGLGLAVAFLHLGKPLKAWRAFLGWRKSWFSREVIALGTFVPLTVIAAFAAGWNGVSVLLRINAALAGVVGVSCSAMIYADTHREFWRASQCFGKFFGSTALLGLATTLAIESVAQSGSRHLLPLVAMLAAATIAKLSFEKRIFILLASGNRPFLTPLSRTARLLAGELGLASRLRVVCGILGGLILPAFLAVNYDDGSVPFVAVTALILCLGGELLERYLFFRAVAPVTMPGGVAG